MELRPAGPEEISVLAELVLGDESQASTVAGMRLFGLESAKDTLELNRVMITSTGSWRTTTVADLGDGIGGMVQVGEASMAFTPEVVTLARRLYGDGYQSFLGPRLAAMGRVQATYRPEWLRIAEIHVAPEHRGKGVGSALIGHVAGEAAGAGFASMALQTLTNNPARQAFEAWGFGIAATITDPEFEALTGAAGNHLMLRDL